MPLEDASPERRNLMITSLAFVAYYYAGGALKDNSVTLSVVNVQFDRPELLGWFAWGLLIWFAYRYWLGYSGKFRSKFRTEIASLCRLNVFKKFAVKNGVEIVADEDLGYHVFKVVFKKKRPIIVCKYGNIKTGADGSIQSLSTPAGTGRVDIEVELKGWRGIFLRSGVNAFCAFKYPSFSSYLVPYLLFLAALLGPIFRLSFDT